jgi:hypothetical protein
MIVDTPQKRRGCRAVLGLIFALYCGAVRPALASSTATPEIAAASSRGAAIASSRHASSAALRAPMSAPDAGTHIGVRFVRRHHRRTYAALSSFETCFVVPASAPAPAPSSAAPVTRDVGVPQYPPSFLS